MPETAATVSTLGLPVIGGGGGGGSGDDDDDMGIPLLIDETLRFRDGRCSVLDGKGGLYSLGIRVVVNSIRDGDIGSSVSTDRCGKTCDDEAARSALVVVLAS